MDDCIFCKIVRGEIPCHKIYEDENVLAFLDISGDCLGHTLVVPKKHCTNILDVEETELNHVMNVVRIISKHYVDDCGFKGINIINNKTAPCVLFRQSRKTQGVFFLKLFFCGYSEYQKISKP